MRLTQEQIKKINNKCPYGQGIFNEPNHIPTNIKGLIVYSRYEIGGYTGGSCYDDSDPHPYTQDIPKDKFVVLDYLLTELCPNITYLQYKEIEKLIDYNDYSENEYYGNSTDYEVQFIELSKLYDLLDTFNLK